MPLTEQNIIKGKSLSHTIPIYFTILFILITTTLLYWTYQSSNAFITQGLHKNLTQRQINAENALDYILENMALAVKYIAADPSLREAVTAMDQSLTLDTLHRSLESGANSRLDILFIKDLNNKIWVDDSSPFFDFQEILPLIAEQIVIDSAPSHLFTFPDKQSELNIVGKASPLISENTGRVIGTLFGGIVLNNNITLMDTVRTKTQVKNLMLLQEGQLIAATQAAKDPIIREAISHLPVTDDDFRRLTDGHVAHYQTLNIHEKPSSLKLVFIIQDTIFADIKFSYQKKFILLLGLLIALSALTLYLVKSMIIAPLRDLSSYAKQIAQGKKAVYLQGPISEFNHIGLVMTETVQGLQQTTEQLQNEINRRQQVMDQLNLHRNSLEQIVEMRTKELNATNKTLTSKNEELNREKTEHLQTQGEIRKLAEAVKNSPVSIVITDSNGTIEYVNPKFSELTQYSFEEVVGQNPQILDAGHQSHEHFEDMWQTILGGQEWHGEFCNKKKDGELFWELASISPILDDDGEILHFVSVKEDITSRKLTEANLQHARRQAEDASKQKSLFLANMSHEIRTPMNAMIGLSELALETDLTEQQYDYLSKIHSSSQGLLLVLNDILDYSKIEAGKLKLENNLFSLPDVIDQVHNIFVHIAIQRGLELQFLIKDDVPSILYGDAGRLRQILTNLIGNGLKFTPQGAISTTISLQSLTEDRASLHFSVVDSGIGIPAKKLSMLFKAFSQINATHTREYGGTGLGLAISKELVEVMGGKLEVESSRGVGSTFSFTLEFKNGDNKAHTINYLRDRQEKDRLLSMQQILSPRILLVEDDSTNQQIGAAILTKAHIDVELADNGAEAVQKYQVSLEEDSPFTAILMDIHMPVLDGYEATAQIRALEQSHPEPALHIPIIAMTAHAMAADQEKGLAAGMDDYIDKPLDNGKLFTTLAHWINKNTGDQMIEPPLVTPDNTDMDSQKQNTLPSTLAGVDLQRGVARLEGHTEIYLQLLKDFTDHYSSSSEDAAELLRQNENETAQRLFHTIKGTAANLCAHQVQEVATQLEHALAEGKNIEELLERFTLAWQELRGSIATLEERGWFKPIADLPTISSNKKVPVKLLAKLLIFLEKMDYKAIESWQELKPFLQDTIQTTKITEIEYSINNYDFPNAASLIKRLEEKSFEQS